MTTLPAGPSIHIYAPPPTECFIRSMDCPTCKRRRFGVTSHYEWYSGELTCLGCGERWNEDGRCERPFARAWRKDSIYRARMFAKRHKAKFGTPVKWADE